MEPSTPSRHLIVIVSTLIFVVSVVIRVPSCYESFWLDELHTAWCVWDSLADVFPRADIGHQTPFYFVGIWFWKQIVGEAEVALRLSSVLAVSLACGVICSAVARWTNSMIAGAAAGLVLALENNSLFFGTELRPYAFVVLFTSLALVSFLALCSVDAGARLGRHRTCLTVSLVLAALTQPTSLGVVAWLPLALLANWMWFRRRDDSIAKPADALALLVVSFVAYSLWQMTLGESWNQRTIWSSFATATHPVQIWEAWDWTWMMLVPVGVMFAVAYMTRSNAERQAHRSVLRTTVTLSVIALGATFLYWLAAFLEWVPVWHRRYFVAILPILTCIVGGAIGVIDSSLSSSRGSRMCTVGVALVLTMWPAYRSGIFTSLRNYPVALVSRGEDWRGAVARVRSLADRSDTVLLDSGLIEARTWLNGGKNAPNLPLLNSNLSAEQLAFLTFPVHGPYQIDERVIPVRSILPSHASHSNTGEEGTFIITRTAPRGIKTAVIGDRWTVEGFGNLSVLSEQNKASEAGELVMPSR